MGRARKKDAFEHEAVAVWRERNIENLWDAFIAALKSFQNPGVAETFDQSYDDVVAHLPVLQNTPLHPLLPPMDSFVGDQNNIPTIGCADREESQMIDESIELVQPKTSDRVAGDTLDDTQPEQKEFLTPQTATKKRSASTLGGGHQSFQHEFQLHDTIQQSYYDKQCESTKKQAKKKHSIPSFLDICCLVPTEEKAIEYLTCHGIFTSLKDTICCHCGYKGFRQKEKNNPKSLKCNRCSKGEFAADYLHL